MKKLTLTFAAVLFTLTAAVGQDLEAPKSGSKIYLQQNTLELEAGNEVVFDMWIVRSKRARRAAYSTPKFMGSELVKFEVVQNSENPDHYRVTATSDKSAAGKMTYIVSGRTTGIHNLTGTTLSVSTAAPKVVASRNDN